MLLTHLLKAQLSKAQLVLFVDHLLMSFWKVILRKQASVKRVIHFCLEDSESEGRSRVPLTPEKRTRGDAIAETPWYNHKKQSATIRDNGSVSKMSYHRVPFNYPEKNKRKRIGQEGRLALGKAI